MNRYVYFGNRDEFYRIDSSQIVYIVASGNYTYMKLASRETFLSFTLSLQKMQAYLSEELGKEALTFMRIGKTYIMNLAYVFYINIPQQRLILRDKITREEYAIPSKETLPISKEALKDLRERLTNQKRLTNQ